MAAIARLVALCRFWAQELKRKGKPGLGPSGEPAPLSKVGNYCSVGTPTDEAVFTADADGVVLGSAITSTDKGIASSSEI